MPSRQGLPLCLDFLKESAVQFGDLLPTCLQSSFDGLGALISFLLVQHFSSAVNAGMDVTILYQSSNLNLQLPVNLPVWILS